MQLSRWELSPDVFTSTSSWCKKGSGLSVEGTLWYWSGISSFCTQDAKLNVEVQLIVLRLLHLVDFLQAIEAHQGNSIQSYVYSWVTHHVVQQRALPSLSNIIIQHPITHRDTRRSSFFFQVPIETTCRLWFESWILCIKPSPAKLKLVSCHTAFLVFILYIRIKPQSWHPRTSRWMSKYRWLCWRILLLVGKDKNLMSNRRTVRLYCI